MTTPKEILTPAALKQLEDAGYVVVNRADFPVGIPYLTHQIECMQHDLIALKAFTQNMDKLLTAATREE